MNEMESRARAFALQYHASQPRQFSGELYIHHCEAVAELVKTVAHSPPMVCAAWLHDTVEDTSATLEDVRNLFGDIVARYVWFLTDVPKLAGNRAQRKQLDRSRIKLAPHEVQTVKLCDLIDNSRSIMEHDKDFAVPYLREKRLLLDEALVGGCPLLWDRADMIVRRGLRA